MSTRDKKKRYRKSKARNYFEVGEREREKENRCVFSICSCDSFISRRRVSTFAHLGISRFPYLDSSFSFVAFFLSLYLLFHVMAWKSCVSINLETDMSFLCVRKTNGIEEKKSSTTLLRDGIFWSIVIQ